LSAVARSVPIPDMNTITLLALLVGQSGASPLSLDALTLKRDAQLDGQRG
jgi:hypothetical protein